MLLRIVVAASLALVVVLATVRYRRTQLRRQETSSPDRDTPPVPAELLEGADRTWVVFTTPYCATCGPVEAALRAADPAARLVRVDAVRDPRLTETFGVRTAPTVLLADGEGTVKARLVGPAAVDRYVSRLLDARPSARAD